MGCSLLLCGLAFAKPNKVAFNSDAMAYGTTWWCTKSLDHHPCYRTKAACTKNGATCAEQKAVFAYSVVSSGDDLVFVHDSAKICEAQRHAFIDGDTTGDITASSACTRVGAKAPPPPRLPAGKAFWCHSYSVKNRALSLCDRDKKRCIASYESKATGLHDRKNAPVHTWMECTKHATAWGWIEGDGKQRWYSALFVDKVHCEAMRKAGTEACVSVK